ncbi:type II secretion system F family protein [Salinibacterium sp. G-O1]|uniref:type II secretion system F family protein n=1 Tax=Salinibacterium sp. G-O1 TaxID=3046208 RepID=UPI0024BAFB56|nr:type II secretion system F family protein [Salinibacterium sp. G-O1]MDJ0334574.1 type II secretion system F family protein [Salinibacterium sp. G-O1]
MTSVVAWAVVAGTGLGFGLWCLASLVPRMSRPRLARRVAPYLVDISPQAREMLAPATPGPLPVLGMLVEPVASRARAALESTLGGAETVARRLRQSGSALTVEAFRSQQLLWGLAGAGLGVAVAIVVAQAQSTPVPVQAMIVMVFAVAGVLGRDYLLQRTARKRLARLSSELPVILEFLTLSLSAGEGILDAMRRISKVSAGELSHELAEVVACVNTGLPLADTLTSLARDLELPAFSRCVEQIVGALERGTPLAEVLRAQAQDSRDDAKRDLLESAGKKEIAMLFPLVFLILPVTILFAIYPGIFVLQVGF